MFPNSTKIYFSFNNINNNKKSICNGSFRKNDMGDIFRASLVQT